MPGGHAGLSPYDKLSSAFRDGALVVSRRMGGPNKRATNEVAQVEERRQSRRERVRRGPSRPLWSARDRAVLLWRRSHKARQTPPIPRSPIPDPGLVVKTKFYTCNTERNEAETIESQTR